MAIGQALLSHDDDSLRASKTNFSVEQQDGVNSKFPYREVVFIRLVKASWVKWELDLFFTAHFPGVLLNMWKKRFRKCFVSQERTAWN